MTFERENRTGHDGGWLWRMDISDREHGRGTLQLIFEPATCPHPDRGAELHVWVEAKKSRYHWVVDEPNQRPSGPPTWTVDTIEVPNSRRTEPPIAGGLEYLVIRALARGDLHGESAASAVHHLFWTHFVQSDEGLTYLCKFAARDTGNFYARERLLHYTRYNDRPGDYQVQSAIEDAMKHNPTLGNRFATRTRADKSLHDAISALLMTREPEEAQLVNVRKIVETNATRMDHVIAGIVDATREDQALLGLRACQRAESDPEFFAAVDAFVLAHPDGRGMITFLKPHCKPPKKVKRVHADDDEGADCYD